MKGRAAQRTLARRALRWAAGALLLLAASLGAERALELFWPLPADALAPSLESRRVLAADGTVLRVLANARGERCIPIPLAEISPRVVEALLAAEDHSFWSHSGADWLALVRAAGQNLARGRAFSGASTVTMQLARIVTPTPRTLFGKLAQVLRARQIERHHDKREILAAYLNLVPFAGNTRGIEAAALLWFGKRGKDLDAVEAATLVGMLPAPGRRRPSTAPRLVALARDGVLRALAEAGRLDAAGLARALQAPMQAKAHAWPFLAVQASEHFLAASREPLVRTTLDPALQHEVEDVVEHASGSGMSGVALVVVARADGSVVALAGSRRDRALGLDATRCARPAGSTLKPFLYALALERGVLGSHGTLADTPADFAGYRPSNFSRTFAGTITLEDALAESRNVPAVRLLRMVGVDAFRDLLARVGLAMPAGQLGLDAALGTVSVRPLELARAYALLLRDDGPCALAPAQREALLSALSLRSPDPRWVEAGRVAFKTGTSSDRRDAWTAAVTERHVVVAWLGDPEGRSEPGLVGARAASELVAPLVAALGSR